MKEAYNKKKRWCNKHYKEMTAITRLDGDKRTAFVYILRHFLMINDMNDVAFLLFYSSYQDHGVNFHSLILFLKAFFSF